jgi:CRISPR-associated protein Cas1
MSSSVAINDSNAFMIKPQANGAISRVHLQSLYWLSSHSLGSARLIVSRKCRNMAHLLMSYLPYQAKAYPERAGPLRRAVAAIGRLQTEIGSAKTRRGLLLLEAKTTKAYWSAVRLLAHQADDWVRTYPHGGDPLNVALNIGYTILGNAIRQTVRNHGLEPSIGVLHEPRDGKEALVYDIEELFRQPVVDATILPLFSRRKSHDAIDGKSVVHSILDRLNNTTHYKQEQWKIRNVINAEILAYLSVIQNHGDVVWIPHEYSWAHWRKKKRDP